MLEPARSVGFSSEMETGQLYHLKFVAASLIWRSLLVFDRQSYVTNTEGLLPESSFSRCFIHVILRIIA